MRQHGTLYDYNVGCRRPECMERVRAYWRSRPRQPAEDREPSPRAPIDAAPARLLALRLLRVYSMRTVGEHYDARHDLVAGTGERQLHRLLSGLRWGVTHAGKPPQRRCAPETEDRLWVLL